MCFSRRKTSNDFSTATLFRHVFIREWKTWLEARDYCKSEGGFLAEMKTDEQHSEVFRLITDTGFDRMWLGASDHLAEGDWKWSRDNSSVDMTQFWGAIQPNAIQEDDDYMCIWNNGALYDCYSTARYPFVCSFP